MVCVKKKACWGVMFLMVAMVGIHADTLPALQTAETVITSDSLLFDYDQRMCVFEGNVIVVDPRVRMECDKLHVFFDENQAVESLVAQGNVVIIQENREATCGRAVYTAADGAIVMTQSPALVRERDRLEGEEIRIYVDTHQVHSRKGRLIVFPDRETSP